MTGAWVDSVDLAGLEHLVVERDSALIYPAAALFDADRSYRYLLTRQWDDRPPAVFIMLNPSTATAFAPDPTVTRCQQRAATALDCGGLVVLNAFAHRSTDPRALRRHPDPVGPDNDTVIARVLATRPIGPVILGWGCNVELRRTNRDKRVVDLIEAAGLEATMLRVTTAGYPQHPLYVPYAAQPVPYQLPAAP